MTVAEQNTQQGYPCPICSTEQVTAEQKACATCQDVFGLADDADQVGAQRVAIGPTDV